MEFKYFKGPKDEMAGYAKKVPCVLCGDVGEGFELGVARVPSRLELDNDGKYGCYACLRAQEFEFGHDTPVGMVGEDGLKPFYDQTQPPPEDFDFASAEALRWTPGFVTWQQGVWLTHCNAMMAYLGEWKPNDFRERAEGGDGRALFLAMTDVDPELWDYEQPEDGSVLQDWGVTYYAFECLRCGVTKGYYDFP